MAENENSTDQYTSMVNYYQELEFNPVFISLETQQQWESHFAKRVNLYQNHLSIPLSLLRDRSVIEFGPNSGENALVLAKLGANLTLVEPNIQVLPRLQALFEQYSLKQQIAEISNDTIDDFRTDQKYDIAIAEGFLFTLPNRDELIHKLASLLTPGGLGIISFNDRFGSLLEITKQVIQWRICQLVGIDDVQSNQALEYAKRLYLDDFSKLKASRTFETWWRDTIVSPYVASKYLWSYPELLPVVEQAGCAFYSCSPQWSLHKQFQWYKAVPSLEELQRSITSNWRRALPYFLTGLPIVLPPDQAVPEEVIQVIARWVNDLSTFNTPQNPQQSIELVETLVYPGLLDQYLSELANTEMERLNTELKQLYTVIRQSDLDALMNTYLSLNLRHLWGSVYHYLCFMNDLGTA